MFSCFCIGFIEIMLMGKSLKDFKNLFWLNNFRKTQNVILDYFLKYNNDDINVKCTKKNLSFIRYFSYLIYPQLDNSSLIEPELNGILIIQIKEREKMSKILNKYIPAFCYAGKILLDLFGEFNGIYRGYWDG